MKELRLHHHQSLAMESTSRFVLLLAGTGGGKTWFGGPWLANEISKYPGEQWFIVAPTYKMLMRATVPTFTECFNGTTLEGELKQSLGKYVLPDGGTIWLGSADRPETLEAGQYRGAWLDEAGQMKFQTWVVIQARLGQKQGRCLLTTTPYAVNWLYHEFYKRWMAGDCDYDVIQFRSADNPYYPLEEFERARKTLDSRLFEMRYEGQFRKMAGLIYPDFGASHIVDEFTPPTNHLGDLQGELVGGLDWGYNNPFVALDIHISDDGVWTVYREHYQSRLTLGEHSEYLDRDILYYADPSGKQEINELRALDHRIYPGNNDVAMGIQKVSELIKDGRLRVSKSCPHLIDEFETYHYNEESEKPVKEDDHCLDALRYAVLSHSGGGTTYFKIG